MVSAQKIKANILSVGLVPLTILAVVLSTLYLLERMQSIDSNLHRKTTQLAASVALASEYGVVTGNIQALQEILQNNLRDPEIISIEVYSNNDELQATIKQNYGQNVEYKHQLSSDASLLHMVKEDIYPSQLDIDDYQRANPADVELANKPVGYVVVTATRYFASEQKQLILVKTTMFALLSLLIVAGFAVFMANTLIRPLTRIITGISQIRAGDLDHRIPEKSGGEVGLLEQNVNAMAQALKQAQENERQLASNALNFEKSKAQTTLESLGEGVITTDNLGNITYINPIAERLTGHSSEQAMHQPLNTVFNAYSDVTDNKIDYPIMACIEHGEVIRHDALLTLCRKDGEKFVIRDTATPIRDPQENILGAVLIFDDFSTIQAMAEKLSYQATHDDLTGLFNRREFETQLDHALQQSIRYEVNNSICYIDLDQFKIVNDTCGHIAGDKLLESLTQALKPQIRQHDVFARLGGDEFGIILRDCPEDKAKELADLIRASVQEFVFVWEKHKFQIGASVGLVHLSNKFNSVAEIMIAADSACYIAKDKGRNRVHEYVENDNDQIRRAGEMRWMQRIQRAIEKDNLVLYAQTIKPLPTKKDLPTHYEFLLRLKEHNVLHTPYTFLPAAERYDLMPEIDRWVIKNALNTIAMLVKKKTSLANSYFHINLSGQSLNVDQFHDFVYESLQNVDVPPGNVIFEITETTAIANMQLAIDFIKSIKQLGCRFALDDFGSGLSSFNYLTSLPIDYIKIDGKIVRDITYNPVNLSIVKSINEISHVMQLQTMAEFVENESIMDKLIECDIDYGQGYAIAKPQPIDELFSLSGK